MKKWEMTKRKGRGAYKVTSPTVPRPQKERDVIWQQDQRGAQFDWRREEEAGTSLCGGGNHLKRKNGTMGPFAGLKNEIGGCKERNDDLWESGNHRGGRGKEKIPGSVDNLGGKNRNCTCKETSKVPS